MMSLLEIREKLIKIKPKYKLGFIAKSCGLTYKQLWNMTKSDRIPYENVEKVSDFLENLKGE